MKIAIVYDMLYPFHIGGVELRNYELAKRLVKRGHEVHMFGAKLWEGPDKIKKEGIYFHGISRYNELYNFQGKRTIFEPLKYSILLFPKLMKEKFDIIETSSFPYFPFFTCLLVSKIKKTPLITIWHQFFEDYWFTYFKSAKAFLARKLEKVVYLLSKNNIAVSKKTKYDLKKIRNEYIEVIENGVSLREIENTPPSKEKSDLIFVGRLIEGKNIELLINSISILKRNFKNIKLYIIGEGPLKNHLQNKVKSMDLTKNIFFLGKLEKKEIYSRIKSSKIFVFPSILEGFGIVVIEAFACGKPVIAVKHKWNASHTLISENENGLVSKNNSKSFATRILKILQNSSLRNKMSKNALQISKAYDWDKKATELEELYKKIAKKDI